MRKKNPILCTHRDCVQWTWGKFQYKKLLLWIRAEIEGNISYTDVFWRASVFFLCLHNSISSKYFENFYGTSSMMMLKTSERTKYQCDRRRAKKKWWKIINKRQHKIRPKLLEFSFLNVTVANFFFFVLSLLWNNIFCSVWNSRSLEYICMKWHHIPIQYANAFDHHF